MTLTCLFRKQRCPTDTVIWGGGAAGTATAREGEGARVVICTAYLLRLWRGVGACHISFADA